MRVLFEKMVLRVAGGTMSSLAAGKVGYLDWNTAAVLNYLFLKRHSIYLFATALWLKCLRLGICENLGKDWGHCVSRTRIKLLRIDSNFYVREVTVSIYNKWLSFVFHYLNSFMEKCQINNFQ